MTLRDLSVLALRALAVCAAFSSAAYAEFTATYAELARSPLNVATTWYSGAVTRDGKFIYGLGHSHNAYGNNSLWVYDPATNTHRNLFPDTGNKWRWQTVTWNDGSKHTVPGSGHWAPLDPVADKDLYFLFGRDIVALPNRNNHQAFYVPTRNEFWVLAGAVMYQDNRYFAGRFSLDTNRWVNLSSSLGEFSAGLIAGTPRWVGANAAQVWCQNIDTGVFFGGMNSTGAVMIEPNPGGPEPYRWAALPGAPANEDSRHTAACVGDTVYVVVARQRVSGKVTTPAPAPFWKLHVPTRRWTRLPDGPPGGYFPTLTYDQDAQALLYYGGSASNRLWVYDLDRNAWQELTVANLPRADMHTGGFIPGFGHVFKGGRRFDAAGRDEGYTASSKMMKIALTRVVDVAQQPSQVPIPKAGALQSQAEAPLPRRRWDVVPQQPHGDVVPRQQTEAPLPQQQRQQPTPTRLVWTKIPIPGPPNSLSNFTKHWRIAQAGNGRVYTLGGDGNGPEGNTGRQDVYSFDPDTGAWRKEAPYCGTAQNPVHWHTDEAGVAWDAKRRVFWKLAGTVYGPEGSCPPGTSRKAKMAQFDPLTGLWKVPAGEEKNFGYVANGILDPDTDRMVQITDAAAWHLDLTTGTWTSYPLPKALRFNAITARLGREVWWVNRDEVLESYHLDTHTLTVHGPWPYPRQAGWGVAMTFAVKGRILAIWQTSAPTQPRMAAVYDHGVWTRIDQGEGWGNTGTVLSDGRIVLMGGGINGPQDHNKQVWVGTLE